MLVSGFTVIRNAEIMGYPVVSSIKSILPLVDEFVVGVGRSDDKTKELIQSINDPKIKIFDSIWDTSKTKGGLILSEKTNEALARCQGDWCFYLQADEVVHEKDLESIKRNLEKYRNEDNVEGLVFDYLHFYGSYGVIATARNWYRREVRVVKRKSSPQSVGDAQGFRIRLKEGSSERKPFVKRAEASIYHYGWVKPPKKMGEKNKHMFRWWHGHKYDEAFDDFEYKSTYGLKPFEGSHPAVMGEFVKAQNWSFEPKPRLFLGWSRSDYRYFISDLIENLTGQRLGEHKNFILK